MPAHTATQYQQHVDTAAPASLGFNVVPAVSIGALSAGMYMGGVSPTTIHPLLIGSVLSISGYALHKKLTKVELNAPDVLWHGAKGALLMWSMVQVGLPDTMIANAAAGAFIAGIQIRSFITDVV